MNLLLWWLLLHRACAFVVPVAVRSANVCPATVRKAATVEPVTSPPGKDACAPGACRIVTVGADAFEVKSASPQDSENCGLQPPAVPALSIAVAARKAASVGGSASAVALIEPIEGAGGSSIATRTYELRVALAQAGSATEAADAATRESLCRFLNDGGRISQLRAYPGDAADGRAEAELFARYGIVPSSSSSAALSGDRSTAIAAVTSAITAAAAARSSAVDAALLNIRARLRHDAGLFEEAAEDYLASATADSSRTAELFRGLGGAYQSLGRHQLAFASYQTAIDLRPSDFATYLKLGLLYEELSLTAKYEGAADHAARCYRHYLDGLGAAGSPADTDVLVRLGNLEIRRLEPAAAVQAYRQALAASPELAEAWFNMATAQLKLRDAAAAAESLTRALKIDPSLVAACYMLASLRGDADGVGKAEKHRHIEELFDFWAEGYDHHVRDKLLYTGPRVLRRTMLDVYNATFQGMPAEARAAGGADVLTWLNGSLEVLDLGCGTGLCGSWFRDYSRRSVGVDLSQKMIDMATKKGCYETLRKQDMERFLSETADRFTLVVAGDSLHYLGALEGVVAGVSRVLRPGGYFAATLSRLIDDESGRDVEDGTPYALCEEGTFAYSREYVRRVAEAAGLEVVVLRDFSSRLERGEPAPGILLVARRR